MGQSVKREVYNFEQFEQALVALATMPGVSAELWNNMSSEITLALHDQDNILLVATEGTATVTIVAVAEELIGYLGPVLVPTSDPTRIVSIVSRELDHLQARQCQAMDDAVAAQTAWQYLIDHLYGQTVEMVRYSAPSVTRIPDFPAT